ncbi:MAG: mechanosensitive ion channel [Sphingomonas bacterium]|nr:mechanosensitive ion channel [Sphingomonas bacterium]
MPFLDLDTPAWVERLIGVLLVVLAVALAHQLSILFLRRMTARTSTPVDSIVLTRLRWPSFWLAIGIALAAMAPGLNLPPYENVIWQRVAGLAAPAILGWVLLALMGAYRDTAQARLDISVEDNLRARRRRTRLGILHRIAVILVVVVILCLMLMSIPSVRSIGVTLAASAGLVGLAIGAAAQPALKNLIAGIQMAFSEPIRIDDVVVIEGEWGRIEEIRLTFVVVKVWDERRLVVPVSKFLENSFQNWTRETSQILGTIIWYLDPAADVARLRAKMEEVVRADRRWDGRFWNMQVTDSKPEGLMELRGLVTAKDATLAFDLRCEVREAIYAFIRDEMPEALPRTRIAPALTPSAVPPQASAR